MISTAFSGRFYTEANALIVTSECDSETFTQRITVNDDTYDSRLNLVQKELMVEPLHTTL